MSPWTASSMSNKVAKICTEKFPIAIFKNLICESTKKEVQHSRSHRVYVWIENCWSQINLRNKKKVSSKKKINLKKKMRGKMENHWRRKKSFSCVWGEIRLCVLFVKSLWEKIFTQPRKLRRRKFSVEYKFCVESIHSPCARHE